MKSGSSIAMSEDGKVLLKTITTREFAFLTKIADSYFEVHSLVTYHNMR
jgi:hypothetical protein